MGSRIRMCDAARLAASAAAVVGCLLLCSSVQGQTATPTPTPQACRGSDRLRISWKASTHQGNVFVRLSQCLPPAGCDDSATPVTTPPITLVLQDAAGRRIARVLAVQDFVKDDLCPGGHETHEFEFGKLRYVFGSEGVTGALLKTKMTIDAPPLFSSPVSVTVADGGGYSLGVVFANCTVRDSGAVVQVRCDDTARYRPPASTPQPTATSNALPTRTGIPTRTTIPTRTPLG